MKHRLVNMQQSDESLEIESFLGQLQMLQVLITINFHGIFNWNVTFFALVGVFSQLIAVELCEFVDHSFAQNCGQTSRVQLSISIVNKSLDIIGHRSPIRG